jgi:hypothetical protein
MIWLVLASCGIGGAMVYWNTYLVKKVWRLNDELMVEKELRSRVEEANKDYVQKLATLSQGTDHDRFLAAVAVMSNGKTDHIPPKP